MRRLHLRAILVTALTIGCLTSAGTSSALARLTSSKSANANSFTTGTWACTAGSATLSGAAVQDSYIDEHSPTTNFGTTNPLDVNGTVTKQQRMLLQFAPLPTIPSGCVFKTATLNLSATTTKSGLTYNIYNLAAAWTDTTVTWSSQPGTTGSAVAVATAAAAGPVAWTVTALVLAQYSGTPNHGFIVEDPAGGSGYSNQTTYQSNEGTPAQRPTLTITWGP